MSTEGGGFVNAALYLAVLVLAVQVGGRLADRRPRHAPDSGDATDVTEAAGGPGSRVSPAVVCLWLTVAVPSVAQNPFPSLLTGLRRDPDLILQHGQYWRILTSVVVQDGGTVGTIFNLVTLAVVAVIAVNAWGPPRALIVFLLAQLCFNTAVTLLSSDVGAGNSGATFGLATSMVALSLVRRLDRVTLGRSLGVVAAGATLLAIGDAHGIAVLGGLVIGSAVALASRPAPMPAQARHPGRCDGRSDPSPG